jgi:hypothetical protein
MAKGRPGGNPDLKRYQFSTDRPEPLTEKLSMRISAAMRSRLSAMENWHEFVRQAIQKALDELPE